MEGKRGCLIIGTVPELATFDADVSQPVTAALPNSEKLSTNVIRLGNADGSSPACIDGNNSPDAVPAARHARYRTLMLLEA